MRFILDWGGMTIRTLATIATSAFLIVSCQSSPQRVNEWKYVADGESDVMSVVEECKKRADDEFERDADIPYADNASASAALLLLYPIVYGVKTDKYFSECMNGRNYANNEEDVKRLIQENRARITGQEKSKEVSKLAEEARVIRIGDYVISKFSLFVIYAVASTDSERVGRFQANERAKVLSIEDEWVQVDIKNIVGWARKASIQKAKN